ncbi:MAG: hypothetical protein IBJ09_11140 [Bacteroidia bacterium]|nr:hypothetical protein [Bacteroidia bacterium]
MGKFISKKDSVTTMTNEDPTCTGTLESKPGLYKPLEAFEWKDASEAEIQKNSIAAYRKYAF